MEPCLRFQTSALSCCLEPHVPHLPRPAVCRGRGLATSISCPSGLSLSLLPPHLSSPPPRMYASFYIRPLEANFPLQNLKKIIIEISLEAVSSLGESQPCMSAGQPCSCTLCAPLPCPVAHGLETAPPTGRSLPPQGSLLFSEEAISLPSELLDLLIDWTGTQREFVLSASCKLRFWALLLSQAMSSAFIQQTLSGCFLCVGHWSGSGDRQEVKTL